MSGGRFRLIEAPRYPGSPPSPEEVARQLRAQIPASTDPHRLEQLAREAEWLQWEPEPPPRWLLKGCILWAVLFAAFLIASSVIIQWKH